MADVLVSLGADALQEAVPSEATVSVWGAPEPATLPAVRVPRGLGWIVDARAAAAALLERVRRCGGRVYEARPGPAVYEAGEWKAVLEAPGGQRVVAAAAVIDATGRSAVFARARGSKRYSFDRLIALYATVHAGKAAPELSLEAVEQGWWYALGNGERVTAAYLTDADLLAHRNLSPAEQWTRGLGPARLVSSLVGKGRTAAVASCSARLEIAWPPAGPGWVAAGDAALSRDPLSGDGALHAVQSGLAAADAVAACLDGDGPSLERYRQRVRGDLLQYLEARAAAYGSEVRWRPALFWRRRAGGSGMVDPGFVPRPVGDAAAAEGVLPLGEIERLARFADGRRAAHEVVRAYLQEAPGFVDAAMAVRALRAAAEV